MISNRCYPVRINGWPTIKKRASKADTNRCDGYIVPVGRYKLLMGDEYLGAFTVGDQLLGAAELLRRMLQIVVRYGLLGILGIKRVSVASVANNLESEGDGYNG